VKKPGPIYKPFVDPAPGAFEKRACRTRTHTCCETAIRVWAASRKGLVGRYSAGDALESRRGKSLSGTVEGLRVAKEDCFFFFFFFFFAFFFSFFYFAVPRTRRPAGRMISVAAREAETLWGSAFMLRAARDGPGGSLRRPPQFLIGVPRRAFHFSERQTTNRFQRGPTRADVVRPGSKKRENLTSDVRIGAIGPTSPGRFHAQQ